MEIHIGAKIKELRLSLSLTQEELADRCELTKGYISQLENDLTSPSIVALKTILSALGTGLKEFFSEETDEKITFTPHDYISKDSGDTLVTWLVPSSQKNSMEPILMEVKQGCSCTFDMPHEGEELGYVLSGSIILHHGNRIQKLKTGDTFYFTADKIHYIENNSAKTAKILWVSSPPNF